jgi:hypothetical protein
MAAIMIGCSKSHGVKNIPKAAGISAIEEKVVSSLAQAIVTRRENSRPFLDPANAMPRLVFI